MANDIKGGRYEDKFEFPLWKLIRKRAEEKDISYAAAAYEVVPEYVKTIRYRDEEYEAAEKKKRWDELARLVKEQTEKKD